MLKLSSYIVRLGTLSSYKKYSTSPVQVLELAKKLGDNLNQEQLKPELDPTVALGGIHRGVLKVGLVAAAFANLNNESENTISTVLKSGTTSYLELRRQVEDKISKATDVETLLSVVDSDILSRKQALKIVSILSEWSNAEKVTVSGFESDKRFIRLCKILGRQRFPTNQSIDMSMVAKNSEDLNTVISIAGDDEAARLVGSLNDKQMIKVMSMLAHKKRRSPALLRTLSYHITKSPNTLDLKSCSDLFFAMASLSYPDTVLVDRICSDIQEKLSENKDKSSVLGSIVTSLGMLKCKDREILDTFTDWMIEHSDITRIQDVSALVLTLAVVGYTPTNMDKLQKLTKADFSNSPSYLEYIWALVVLNSATKEQIASVLSSEFTQSLKDGQEIPHSLAKKLLNINSYAILLMPEYKGPFIDDTVSKDIPLSYSKDKKVFVASLLDALKSLLTSEANLKTSCNSRMGFLYDAECLLDSKCNPYPVNSQPPKGKTLTKVAMLGLDYHDICRQTNDPLGTIGLYKQLLEAQNYRVLLVPYTEYNYRDKLVNRVQYIEKRLKDIVQNTNTTKLK